MKVLLVHHGPTLCQPGHPTAVIADKIKHIYLQKESKYTLLPNTSVLPLCSQSLELFQPLAKWAEAWQAIPSVSEWVMAMIRWGYTLQLARRPPRFRSVLATTVRSEDTQVLHAEVMLQKGAIICSSRPERVKLLQPLVPRPQKRRWPATYSRSQTPESRPGKKVFQDDHFEADLLANMCRGLVHDTGSERHLLLWALNSQKLVHNVFWFKCTDQGRL